MRPTVPCPNCRARLELPALPTATAQCPRCRHVFAPTQTSTQPKPFNDGAQSETPPDTEVLRGAAFAKLAVLLLALTLLSYGVQLYLHYEQIQILSRDRADIWGRFVAEWHNRLSWQEQKQMADFVHSVLFATTTILFLCWLFCASNNAWNMHAKGMYYVPSTAVAAFFVPVINLFWPYLALQEMWRASHPRAVDSPHAWKYTAGTPLIGSWWLCFLAAVGLAMFSWMVSLNKEDEYAAAILAMLSNGFAIVAGTLLILIIRGIVLRQKKRFERLAAEDEP